MEDGRTERDFDSRGRREYFEVRGSGGEGDRAVVRTGSGGFDALAVAQDSFGRPSKTIFQDPSSSFQYWRLRMWLERLFEE